VLITFFRSSSYNTWSFCPMQYYLTYTVGYSNPPVNNKATKGTIVHKGLELLARRKLAEQQGEKEFLDPEIGKQYAVDLPIEQAFSEAWLYYTEKESHWLWSGKDRSDCWAWFNNAIEFNNGMWNPLRREILHPEQYFDFVIEKPWAKYNYLLPDGRKMAGYLGLKGTMDLITKLDNETIENIDWKTGQRKDWATGQRKDWRKLRDDPQLRLYHYAMTRLYPDVPHIIITIVFVQDGGAFSLDFGPRDIPVTESMIRERFEKIRDCERPPRIITIPSQNWKCQRLCSFYSKKLDDSDKSICDGIHDEIVELGISKVTAKRADLKKTLRYGEGGGMSNRDKASI
jgi:hypothetical protein